MYTRMKHYELVCVIDGGMPSADITELKKKIEKQIPKLVSTDEMGMLPVAYPLNGQDQAYFVSYHIQADADDVKTMSGEFRLMKGLQKFVFYVMKDNEVFLHFGDLQKQFAKMEELQEEKKQASAPEKKPSEKKEESDDE